MKGSFKGLNGFEEKLQGGSPPRKKTSHEKEYSPREFFEGVVERVTVSGAIVRFDNREMDSYLPKSFLKWTLMRMLNLMLLITSLLDRRWTFELWSTNPEEMLF